MSAALHPFNPDKNFLEVPAQYPFPSTSGKTQPLILCSHWDPTKVLTHIMPDRQAALPLSFRPMTKICMDYVTSAAPEPLPASGNMVYPPGGQIYPPDRYLAAIDNESLLRRQDRPLGTCEKDQWLPSPRGELFQSSVPMSMTPAPTSRMIDELSMPKVLIKPTSNKCRIEQTPRDRLPFNNATKMQKYNK